MSQSQLNQNLEPAHRGSAAARRHLPPGLKSGAAPRMHNTRRVVSLLIMLVLPTPPPPPPPLPPAPQKQQRVLDLAFMALLREAQPPVASTTS